MNVKVLVAFHTNAPKTYNEIFQRYPDVMVPVLGSACRYKRGSSEFFDNMQKDDDGINLSIYNRALNEFTVAYWGYKNQDKLGYPDMIGLAHYRRFLDVDYHNLDRNKIYVRRTRPREIEFLPHFFIREISEPVWSMVLSRLINTAPLYQPDFETVTHDMAFFDKNMFIMNTTYLDQYMSFMLPMVRVLFDPQLLQDIEDCKANNPAAVDRFLRSRSRGYLVELLTAVFMEHLRQMNCPLEVVGMTKDSFNKY